MKINGMIGRKIIKNLHATIVFNFVILSENHMWKMVIIMSGINNAYHRI